MNYDSYQGMLVVLQFVLSMPTMLKFQKSTTRAVQLLSLWAAQIFLITVIGFYSVFIYLSIESKQFETLNELMMSNFQMAIDEHSLHAIRHSNSVSETHKAILNSLYCKRFSDFKKFYEAITDLF